MLEIKLQSHKNYDGERLARLLASVDILKRTVNSDAFRERILQFSTDGKLTFSYKKNLFRQFDHYTNEEVYRLIMQAQESTGNISDGQIDLYLELIEGGSSSAIGYGYPGDETIYTYSAWYDNQNTHTIAGHIAHEWSHKIGFDHAFYPWQDKFRDHSVPYAIGNLVTELARAI